MPKRKLKVTGRFKNRKEVPQINLCGDWLKGLGYKIGTYVILEYDDEKIIIKRLTSLETIKPILEDQLKDRLQ